MVEAVLQLDIVINSSLVNVFKALNSLTIHCSHLLIPHFLVTCKITLLYDICHILAQQLIGNLQKVKE